MLGVRLVKLRRKIKKEMYISVSSGEQRIAIAENGVMEDFYIEKVASKRLVGSIYKGRVEAILPGLRAAFVDIGISRNGFLYLDEKKIYDDVFTEEITPAAGYKKDKPASLAKGQEILVQVVREEIGTKGPRLTRRLSLPGRFIVLVPQEHHIGISKRIEDPKERMRIKKIFSQFRLPSDAGIIVRTEGEGASAGEFKKELHYLINLWATIIERAKSVSAPKLVYEEYDLLLRAARDLFNEEIDRVLIDSKDEFRRIYTFMRSFMPSLRRRIRLYKGKIALFERMGIEKQLETVFNRKIQLKSGGYIVIEPTEALVTIDVNTGRFTGRKDIEKKDPEETAFLTNREAAEEIAKQLRLKDLGGIIVIDFIDMKRSDHKKIVLNALREGTKRDKARMKILDFSEFGVVEMTRQRMRKSVEGAVYKTCPHCSGMGLVKR